MHYRIFYAVFTLFYRSWGWTSGQSVSIPDCSFRLHYCMVENGYQAVNCINGPVSVPDDVITSNKSLWTIVPKGYPFCGQSGHRIVELNQTERSKIQSLQLKGDGVVTFVCPTKDICYLRITILHVMSMPKLLNVSLVYYGNQFLGERGKLTCTIDWARNDTSIRKTWFRTREQSMGTSQIGKRGDDVATSEKYTLVFDPLKRRDAKEYQCGAMGLAFGAVPIRVSAEVVIHPRTRNLHSIHAITSTPLSPSLESSMTGSTKNGTWTLTETTNSIMTVTLFSNLQIGSSMQSFALPRTQTSAIYSSCESPSTLGSSLLSSPEPESYTSHSQSKTPKSQLRPTKDIPKASMHHRVPTKVRPIFSVASVSRRLFSSLFLWQLFMSGSLVLCCVE